MAAKRTQVWELGLSESKVVVGRERTPAFLQGLGSWKWSVPEGPLIDLWQPFRELPPASTTRRARLALATVTVLVVTFIGFYTAYLFSLHDAYLTHAEDMGIMTQALWNTTHGELLHQTVCNIVSDTNCLGNSSRLAIHFEPILFPLSLLYWVYPSAKTLQLVQTVVVATGAFPAYWIASRRLGNVFIGVVFALMYLLHASLDSAVTFDFHAVTLSAAFLMFALYFMLTRNTIGIFVACLLAMSTKEEVALSVAVIGVCTLVFQRRWRVGACLLGLAVLWIIVEVLIMRAASPTGYSSTISRYSQFGTSPTQISAYVVVHPVLVLRDYVLAHARVLYFRALIAPLGYLAILSPLVLLITAPALAINVLSSDPAMYSGFLQYTAESVPIMVFAAIQGTALVCRVSVPLIAQSGRLLPKVARAVAGPLEPLTLRGVQIPWVRWLRPNQVLAVTVTVVALGFCVHSQRDHNYTPLGATFSWPTTNVHTRIADQLVAQIPPTASVSAQSNLVPHLSNRRSIYLFPDGAQQADYVLLDTTGERYPLESAPDVYQSDVAHVLANPAYQVVETIDGFILLKHTG